MALWWEIALFGLGLILIMVEVFITPGFGVMGISGILCVLAALLAIAVPNAPGEMPVPKGEWAWQWFTQGVLWLSLGFIASVVSGAVLSRYLPRAPIARRLFLGPAEAVAEPPVAETAPVKHVQVGDLGTVEGMCRPVGKVRFGDDLLDASSEGDVIPPGTRVRVLRREGNRLIVESL
jgi:membrane-bound serine protease (ClpP class)